MMLGSMPGLFAVVLCVLHGLRPPDNSDGIVLHALGDRCKERARERETKKSDVKMNSAPMNMHFLTADVPSMGDHVT